MDATAPVIALRQHHCVMSIVETKVLALYALTTLNANGAKPVKRVVALRRVKAIEIAQDSIVTQRPNAVLNAYPVHSVRSIVSAAVTTNVWAAALATAIAKVLLRFAATRPLMFRVDV
jgi:hypothetical protein